METKCYSIVIETVTAMNGCELLRTKDAIGGIYNLNFAKEKLRDMVNAHVNNIIFNEGRQVVSIKDFERGYASITDIMKYSTEVRVYSIEEAN